MPLIAALLLLAPTQSTSTLFGVDAGTGDLIRAATPGFGATLTTVGATGAAIEALDFDAAGQHLWAITRAAGGGVQVGSLDLDSGAFTPRGHVAVQGQVTDLAAAPASGDWFLAETSGADTVLWRGRVQWAGSLAPWLTLPGSGSLAGLTVERDGHLVALQAVGGRLLRIDPTSGVVTPLGVLPTGSGVALGLDCDWSSGALVTVLSGASPRLVSLDPVSGTVTILDPLQGLAVVPRVAVRRGAPSIVSGIACAPAVPNSTGVAARIGVRGSQRIEQNDVQLFAGSMPAQSFGLFLASFDTTPPVITPGSVGRLCLGLPIARLTNGSQLLPTGPSGSFSLSLDLNSMPGLTLAGWQRCHFQAWFRDSHQGNTTSNFTAAASVDFSEQSTDEPHSAFGVPQESNQYTSRPVDFDGDGDLDLLVARGTVQLRRNDAGHFVTTAPFPGAFAHAVEAGDFDGDGMLDLLTINSGRVVVLWNDGGAFSASTTIINCGSGAQIDVADLDADGYDDVVFQCAFANRIVVRFGHPGRDLSFVRGVPHLGNPLTHEIADVDGDGRLDFLVYSLPGPTAPLVQFELCRGQPGRQFGLPSQISFPGTPRAYALGDVDSDGDPDLVYVTQTSDQLAVARNAGGSFTTPTSIALTRYVTDVAVGDFDGDGRADAVVTLAQTGGIGLLRGHGDGTFLAPTLHTGCRSWERITMFDLDNDGRREILTPSSASGYMTVFRAGAQDPPGLPRELAIPSVIWGSLTPWLEDLDEDGDLDLYFVSDAGSDVPHYLMRNAGDGTFSAATLVGLAPFAEHLEFVDMNHDGHLDRVSARSQSIDVALGDGLGGFAPVLSTPNPGLSWPTALDSGDFDRDGHMDLLFSVNPGPGGGVLLLRGNGQGGFGSQQVRPGPWGRWRALDLDGDGWLDAVTTSDFGGTAVLYGDGLGALLPAVSLTARNGSADFADLDGDGRLDFVHAVHNGTTGELDTYLQRGPRAFERVPQVTSSSLRIEEVALRDLDGDGTPDLLYRALANGGSGREHLGWLRNDGFGTLVRESRFHSTDQLQAFWIADLNGDSSPDILVLDSQQRMLSLLLHR